jgi:hypothetical protein
MNAIGFSRHSPLCCSRTARDSSYRTYRFRLALPSTPSIRTIPPTAYRFQLLLPRTPSIWAINSIPPAAFRFRPFSPLPPPSVLAELSMPPLRMLHRCRLFLPSWLSDLLAIPLCCSWLSKPSQPLMNAFGFSRHPSANLVGPSRRYRRHLSG